MQPFSAPHERVEAFRYIAKISHEMVAEKKAAVLVAADGRALGKNEFQNNLLSLLIKSNLASDVPDSMRMDDEEITGQITTFLAAGHEVAQLLPLCRRIY